MENYDWLTVAFFVIAGIIAVKRFFPNVKLLGWIGGATSGAGSVSSAIKDKGGDPTAAIPILIMWPVALFILWKLFPKTWSGFTGAGLLIATALVAIYAASRMWTKKADRFAVTLFTIAVLMVLIHEKPLWSGVAEKTRAVVEDMVGPFDKNDHIYRLAYGETADVFIPQRTTATLDCTGDVSFTVTWKDDLGEHSSSGTCQDLQDGNGLRGVGTILRPHFRFAGGSGGGTVFVNM